MKQTARSAKSYTGCQKCKTRKIKCDERRPECSACLKAGLTCPGFVQQIRWSQKHEKFNPPNGPGESSTTQNDSAQSTEESSPARPTFSSGSHSTSNSQGGHPITSNPRPEISPWNNMMFTGLDFLNMPENEENQFGALSTLGVPMAEMNFPFDMTFATAGMWSSNDVGSMIQSPPRDNSGPSFSRKSDQGSTSPSNTRAEHLQLEYGNNDSGSGDNPGTARSNLLGTYYRLSSPTQVVPQFSEEHLVKHYFDTVCALCSCFDSQLNPFRTIVSKLWESTPTISLAIQSMALSDLSNHYLYLAPMGRIKRWQSWQSLQRDLNLQKNGKISLEQLLMSLLLLGISSTWDTPNNLGLPFLFIARKLMQLRLHGGRSHRPQTHLPNEDFFLEAMMHWEMLISFVDPVPMTSFPGFAAIPQIPRKREALLPHPWTAVTSELHWALAEVGRLLRRALRKDNGRTDSEGERKSWSDADRKWAASLEAFIYSLKIPTFDDIRDYGDKNTPKSDIISVASAHRYMCLLELYFAFPDLIGARVSTESSSPVASPGRLDVSSVQLSGYSEQSHSRLCTLSLRTLRCLDKVVISSGVCRFLPLILVSCAGQLRTPSYPTKPSGDQSEFVDEVLEARYAIEERMLSLSRKFPQRKMLQILDIIKETWQRLDNETPNAHWLDVTHENGWQTVLG